MANNNGKRMVKEDLLNYLEAVQTNYPDPSDIGGGGSSYTAGTGIDITNDVISVDSTVVALKSDLLDYVTTSELATELSNYVTSTDLAAELLDYAELSDLATVATTGSYNDLSNKPDLSVYAKLNDDTQNITANNITVTPGAGYIHTTYGPTTIAMSIPRTPGYTITIPTKDGTMALTSDIPSLTGYATESWVTNQGYSTFSGSYNDLTDKPTIPDAVSGTNDGTNWTSITIGNVTKTIPSGSSAPTNMVTTNTRQSIISVKTIESIGFGLEFKPDYDSQAATPGLCFKNYNGNTKGYLSYVVQDDSLVLGRYMSYGNGAKYLGFQTQDSNHIHKVLVPNTYRNDNTTDYLVTSINNTRADASGNVTINIPDAVSGTNDGTNWTSLTIGNTTYNIPSGGSGSGPTVTRYTGYKDYPASTSGSIYAQFSMNSSTLANFLNIEDVKEGDYLDITVKYSWDNKGEYENYRFYIPAKPTSSSHSFPNIKTSMYDVDNNKMEQYTFENPYSPTQATTAGTVFQSGYKSNAILYIDTFNRNHFAGEYGTMYATIVAVDHYSF